MDDADIRAIALDCGFKLKPQPSGLEDLNPYVYRFAREILSATLRAEDVKALRERLTPPAQEDEPVAHDMRMDAYYYRFDSTGVLEIDKILSAIAWAGKSYHHTCDWCEDANPYESHTGQSPIEWIQNAANEAAMLCKKRPDNSGLRKAAGELLKQLDWACDIKFSGHENSKAYYKAARELRVALEGE